MNKMLSKEEILDNVYNKSLDSSDGYSYSTALKAMEDYAEQKVIAFASWKDENYIQHPNGYYSKFNDGSHGKSHITPKFHTLTSLYQIYKQSQL